MISNNNFETNGKHGSIKITNSQVLGLLHELEELDLTEVLEKHINEEKVRLSEKHKGIITKEEGESLNQHIKQMRAA